MSTRWCRKKAASTLTISDPGQSRSPPPNGAKLLPAGWFSPCLQFGRQMNHMDQRDLSLNPDVYYQIKRRKIHGGQKQIDRYVPPICEAETARVPDDAMGPRGQHPRWAGFSNQPGSRILPIINEQGTHQIREPLYYVICFRVQSFRNNVVSCCF